MQKLKKLSLSIAIGTLEQIKSWFQKIRPTQNFWKIVLFLQIDFLIWVLKFCQGNNTIQMGEFAQGSDETEKTIKQQQQIDNNSDKLTTRIENQLENRSATFEYCANQKRKSFEKILDDGSGKKEGDESDQSTNHQTFNQFDKEQISLQKIQQQAQPQNSPQKLNESSETSQNQNQICEEIVQKQVSDPQSDELKKSDDIEIEDRLSQKDDSNKGSVENPIILTEELRNKSPSIEKSQEIPQDNQEVKEEFSQQADIIGLIKKQDHTEDNQETDFNQELLVKDEKASDDKENVIIEQVENNPLNESLAIMEQIFQKSYKNRAVPYELRDFVGDPQDFGKLVNNYFGGQKSNYKEAIKQMSKELKGYRRIRGDGNCFYTAFTYQYLRLLLEQPQRKEEFLQQINDLVVTITYQNIKIENNKFIVQEFIRQFCELQNEEDLFERIKNPEEIFYGLSIMVMRNYIIQIYNNQKELVEMGGQEYIIKNIQTWEEECNSNEIIISALANHLKLNVIVHFIDKKNQSYDRKSYGEEEQPKIALLLSPGHYQIGLL